MRIDPSLHALLAPFKQDRNDEASVLLVDDKPALRLLSAWVKCPIRWEPPSTDPPKEEHDLWEWLWVGVQFDIDRLAKRAGLQPFVAKERWQVLQDNRLVFPDGTVPEAALSMMQAHVRQYLIRSGISFKPPAPKNPEGKAPRKE